MSVRLYKIGFIFIYLGGKKLTSGICNHAVMTGCLIKWIFTVLH